LHARRWSAVHVGKICFHRCACVPAAHLLRVTDPATGKPLEAGQLKAEVAAFMAAGGPTPTRGCKAAGTQSAQTAEQMQSRAARRGNNCNSGCSGASCDRQRGDGAASGCDSVTEPGALGKLHAWHLGRYHHSAAVAPPVRRTWPAV
jgi:hypothetical protein